MVECLNVLSETIFALLHIIEQFRVFISRVDAIVECICVGWNEAESQSIIQEDEPLLLRKWLHFEMMLLRCIVEVNSILCVTILGFIAINYLYF